MRKLFAANLIFLLLLNVIVKPLWIFAIDRNVQIVLGAQEYGFYFALFNFSLLFNFFLDLGITNFNNREISYNPQLISQQFVNVLVIKLVLALVYFMVTLGIGISLGFGKRHIVLLAVLALNQFLASLLLFIRSNLNGLHFFKADSVLSVMDKAIVIVFISMLLWGNIGIQLTVEVFALSQTLAYMIAILIAFWFLQGKYSIAIYREFDRNTVVTLVKKGLPFAVLVLLMTLYSRLDTVMVERLCTDGAVSAGIYAQAFRLFDAFNMYSYLFAALMLPIYSRMVSNQEDITELFNFSFNLILIPVVAIAVPVMIYNRLVMSILYHEHVDVSSKALVFLMGSFVFVALSYLFGTALTAKGKIWLLCRISLGAVVVSLVAMLILIPRFGVIGAAMANLVANAIAALLQAFFFMRRQGKVISTTSVLKISLYTLIYSVLGLIIQHTVGNSLTGCIATFASSLLVVFGLRIFSFKAIINIARGI